MGDPDLSAEAPERRPGLVIYPLESLDGARRRRPRSEWVIVVGALVVAAAIIALALLLR